MINKLTTVSPLPALNNNLPWGIVKEFVYQGFSQIATRTSYEHGFFHSEYKGKILFRIVCEKFHGINKGC